MSGLDELGDLDAVHQDRTGRGVEFSTEEARLLDELLASADIGSPMPPLVRPSIQITDIEAASQYVDDEAQSPRVGAEARSPYASIDMPEGERQTPLAPQEDRLEIADPSSLTSAGPPAPLAPASDSTVSNEKAVSGAPVVARRDWIGESAGAPFEHAEHPNDAVELEESDLAEAVSQDEMSISATVFDSERAISRLEEPLEPTTDSPTPTEQSASSGPVVARRDWTGIQAESSIDEVEDEPPQLEQATPRNAYSTETSDDDATAATTLTKENKTGESESPTLSWVGAVSFADAGKEVPDESAELADQHLGAWSKFAPEHNEMAPGEELVDADESSVEEPSPFAVLASPAADGAQGREGHGAEAMTEKGNDASKEVETQEGEPEITTSSIPKEPEQHEAARASFAPEVALWLDIGPKNHAADAETSTETETPVPAASVKAVNSPASSPAPKAFSPTESMTYVGSRPKRRTRSVLVAALVVLVLIAALGAGFVALKQNTSTSQWRQRDNNEVALNQSLTTRDSVLATTLVADHTQVTSLDAKTAKLNGQVASLQAQLAAKDKTLGRSVIGRLTSEAATVSTGISTCGADMSSLRTEINSDLLNPRSKDPHLRTNTQAADGACAAALQDSLRLQSALRGAQ